MPHRKHEYTHVHLISMRGGIQNFAELYGHRPQSKPRNIASEDQCWNELGAYTNLDTFIHKVLSGYINNQLRDA